MKITLFRVALLCAVAGSAHAQSVDALSPQSSVRLPVEHGSLVFQRAAISRRADARLPASPWVGRRCPSPSEAFGGATAAVFLLAVPVSAIAGAVADDGWKAGRWAFYTGAAWSYGVTVYLVRQEQCHSTDGMAYIWTPIIAAGSAFIATRF